VHKRREYQYQSAESHEAPGRFKAAQRRTKVIPVDLVVIAVIVAADSIGNLEQ